MEKIPLKYLFIACMIILAPAVTQAAVEAETWVGTYKSTIENRSITFLHLNADKTATIECILLGGDQTRNVYHATWVFRGADLSVTYNGIEQILTIHKQLSLKDYGVDHSIPGLSTSKHNKEYGLLDSVKLWREDSLKDLLSDGETKIRPPGTGFRISLSVAVIFIIFFITSAIAGRHKPPIGACLGAVVLPLLGYFFSDSRGVFLAVLATVGLILGYLAGLIGPLFASGFKGKGHNTGPSFMSGFGGGRAARPGGIILSDEERKNR